MKGILLDQPQLPLDERYRLAEQYSFDFSEPAKLKPTPVQVVRAWVCLGNCNVCPRCDNNQ